MKNFEFQSPFNDIGQQSDIPLENIREAEQLEDGSSIYHIYGNSESEKPALESDTNFYANLASEVNSTDLSNLASTLLDDIKNDKDSRSDWESTISVVLKYLGIKIDEFRNVPFMRACAAYDSTLMTAVIRAYSIARAELFPAAGPAKSEIIGSSNQKTEDEGERVKIFMNHYLTTLDEDYYPDSEQLLMYTVFFGSAFRKVYQDPILNRPVARTIKPQDLIVNINTTSLLSSTRITHRTFLTKRDVMLRERTGDFIKGTLGDLSDDSEEESNVQKLIKSLEGISKSNETKSSLFTYYEVHVDLDPEKIELGKLAPQKGDDLPRPYIVTISEKNKKIASIKRGWKQNDSTYTRKHSFVHYYYLHGFGLYGIGLAHLIGSNAIVSTSILRQLIDAGTLKNFPGGLKQAGLRIENNDKSIGPAEFVEVETGGRPIQECIMLMPYSEPSQVLASLISEMNQKSAMLAGTAETEIPESSQNAPVGTTLALLEVANRAQSSVLRSLRFSLGLELKYLFNLFGEYLPDQPYPFSVPGRDTAIMRQDFNDRVNIVPVSDPNVLTSTHRLMAAEAILKLANAAPQLHNLREAYHRMYQAMNIENIDKILTPEEQPTSLDAVSENMTMLMGKQVVAALWQDHEAHNILHKKFAEEQKQINPQAYAAAMMHAQVHDALHILQMQMPEALQDPQAQQMPVQQFLMIPDIQNALSKHNAEEAIQQQQKLMEEMQNQPKPLDPTMVMMADVEQKREAARLKDEEVKLKTETESFKAGLKFESEKAKINAQKEMAEDKNEVNLAIAKMKSPNPINVE